MGARACRYERLGTVWETERRRRRRRSVRGKRRPSSGRGRDVPSRSRTRHHRPRFWHCGHVWRRWLERRSARRGRRSAGRKRRCPDWRQRPGLPSRSRRRHRRRRDWRRWRVWRNGPVRARVRAGRWRSGVPDRRRRHRRARVRRRARRHKAVGTLRPHGKARRLSAGEMNDRPSASTRFRRSQLRRESVHVSTVGRARQMPLTGRDREMSQIVSAPRLPLPRRRPFKLACGRRSVICGRRPARSRARRSHQRRRLIARHRAVLVCAGR